MFFFNQFPELNINWMRLNKVLGLVNNLKKIQKEVKQLTT